MNTSHLSYIQQNFLKKGQTLSDTEQFEQNGLGGVDVFHATARYRKKVGRYDWITSLTNLNPTEDIQRLGKLFHSSRVSKSANQLRSMGIDAARLDSLFQQDLLMRKTDYDQDGRTSIQVSYVAGLVLHRQIEGDRQAAKAAEMQQLQARIARADTALDQFVRIQHSQQPQREARERFVELMQRLQAEILLTQTWDQPEQVRTNEPVLDSDWTLSRRMAYSDFLIAIAEVAASRSRFDWKEIGARFYREIGGSKRFDRYKEDFLLRLETQLDRPLALLGLVSTGSLYSVYFSGQLTGEQGLFYPAGYTHALTDLTTFLMNIKSDARFLWLVENRAVLIRMTAEDDFLERTDSLVIGLDGQLRGAHRKLIRDLLQGSPNITRIMVWCDYDKSGFDISAHLYRLLQETEHEQERQALPVAIRCIASDAANSAFPQAYDWSTYCRLAAAYTDSPAEQEIEMGGAEDWMRWMTD